MDCNFCGKRIPTGTEYIYVTSKGKALYFCSSKCQKNLIKLNRKPRETKWTQSYREEKEARLKLLAQKPVAQVKEAALESKKEPAHEHVAKEQKEKAKAEHKAEAHHKEGKPKVEGKSKEHAAKKEAKKPKK